MCELLDQLYHCLQHRRVFTGQGIPGAAQRRGIADNPLGGQPRRVGERPSSSPVSETEMRQPELWKCRATESTEAVTRFSRNATARRLKADRHLRYCQAWDITSASARSPKMSANRAGSATLTGGITPFTLLRRESWPAGDESPPRMSSPCSPRLQHRRPQPSRLL